MFSSEIQVLYPEDKSWMKKASDMWKKMDQDLWKKKASLEKLKHEELTKKLNEHCDLNKIPIQWRKKK
jgi:hypothetical protein